MVFLLLLVHLGELVQELVDSELERLQATVGAAIMDFFDMVVAEHLLAAHTANRLADPFEADYAGVLGFERLDLALGLGCKHETLVFNFNIPCIAYITIQLNLCLIPPSPHLLISHFKLLVRMAVDYYKMKD